MGCRVWSGCFREFGEVDGLDVVRHGVGGTRGSGMDPPSFFEWPPKAQNAGATVDGSVRMEVGDGGKVPFAKLFLRKVGTVEVQVIPVLGFV